MIRYPDRIKRARLPTPVEPARRMSNKLGVELLVKRDDLTGSSLSGNKIRKLEFLFADAAAEGADTVITCGGEQSNHCRATAIAAAELGLRSYLLLRTENPKEPPAAEANILLDRLVGADIRWVTREEYKRRVQLFTEVQGRARAQRRKAVRHSRRRLERRRRLGLRRAASKNWRTSSAINQLTLVYAAGSGGTGAGLILGIKLLGLPWRAVGINVCDDKRLLRRGHRRHRRGRDQEVAHPDPVRSHRDRDPRRLRRCRLRQEPARGAAPSFATSRAPRG